MSINNKKVLLVHAAPQLPSFQPLAILTLAKSLMDAGYEPLLFDTTVEDFRNVKDKIPWDQLLCVGISSWSGPQIMKGLEISKFVKETMPDIPVVWGGIHASLLPEQTAQNEYVDVVVRGEGEETFVELLQAIRTGDSFDKVKGIVFRSNHGLNRTEDREFVDLNNDRHLPYDLLRLDKYAFDKVFYYSTSRGCPYNCIFCYNLAFNKRKWRRKDPEVVLNDLDHLIPRFKPKYIVFEEDNFFVDFKRAEAIMRGIVERGFSFTWTTTCRADYLCRFDDAFFELMKKSGVNYFNIGGESGSPRILQLIKKQITPEHIIKSAQRCKQFGIEPIYSFIAGVPTETKEEQEATLDLIEKLWDMDIAVNGYFIATAVPGTPLFDIAKKYGLEIPKSLEEWGSWQAYINDEKGTPWLSQKQRESLMVYSQIVRFFYITRNLRSLKDKRGLKKTLLMIFKYLVYPIFAGLARLRWKHRFTAFPVELKIWEFFKNKYVGYY